MSDTPTAIRAVVFDAYGTLFDLARPTARLAARIGAGAERLGEVWRAKQLEYTWLLSLMDRYRPFDAVTADALDMAMALTGVEDDALKADLLALFGRLEAYEDTAPGLDRLAGRGLVRAILSNGAPAMLAATVEAAGLADRLEAVLSADAVGVYKPHPAVYRLAVDRLAVPPSAIAFVSSNAWDIAGAAAFGFRTLWLNRAGRPPERLGLPPAATIDRLDQIDGLLAEL